MSSWSAHQQRTTPSSEPGTDWYCPIGTPVLSPADGRIYAYGASLGPATGRWVGIDFTNGWRFRAMHFSDFIRTRGTLERGEPFAYSGASGYGREDWSSDPATGGAHVHGTLWPEQIMRFGYRTINGIRMPYTIDFMAHADIGGATAGVGATPLPTPPEEDEAMYTIFGNEQRGYMIVGPDLFIEVGSAIEKATGVPGPAILSAFQAAKADGIMLDTASFDRLRISLLAGRPQTAPVQPIIDVDVIRETIKTAFASASITADVSAEDLDAIANRVVDVQAARLAS
jgi:murein DD-endopeptidase MepM/ murein hydrolase activator NlpD